MARIRSMKPELWDDEALGRTPVGSRLLFLGMISLADDEGRLRASPHLLKARLFAYNDDLDLEQVTGWLNALALAGVIDLYVFEGQTFAHVCNWEKHQRVDKPRPSSLPEPSEGRPLVTAKDSRGLGSAGSYDTALESGGLQGIPEDSRGFANVRENSPRKGREGKGRDKEGKGDVRANALTRVSKTAIHELYDHWRLSFGKTSTVLNDKRRKAIADRLAEGYDMATLKRAIDGVAKFPYVVDAKRVSAGAANERFDNLELICRTGENVERFAALADAPTNVVPLSKGDRYDHHLRALERQFIDEDGDDAA